MLPLIKEFLEWWKERGKMRWSIRPIMFVASLGLGLVLLFFPWINTVSVPAVKMAQNEKEVYAPDDAQIISVFVKDNQKIKVGQRLAALYSPRLESELNRIDTDLDYVKRQIIISELAPTIRSDLTVLKERQGELEESRKGVMSSISRLDVMAEDSGIAVDVSETMQPGTWVNKQEPLLRIISTNGTRYLAYVPEESVGLLHDAKTAKFFSDTHPDNVETVSFVAKSSATDGYFTELALSKEFGGLIDVTRSENQYKTVGGWYQYSFVNNDIDSRDRSTGLVVIKAKARSPFQMLVNRVLTVLGREHVV